MIFDRIENAALYDFLGRNFVTASRWLSSTDLKSLPAGRVEIDGSNVYVLVQEYAPKDPAAIKWEAHRKYADIQFIASGEEKIGYVHQSRSSEVSYDETKDFVTLSAKGDFFIRLAEGDFAIFLPHDGHLPGLAGSEGSTAMIKKIVVKIRLGE
jgi:YhcH/YjgK/YiaL family protein